MPIGRGIGLRLSRSRGDDESRPNGRCSRQGPVSRRDGRGRKEVRRSNKPCEHDPGPGTDDGIALSASADRNLSTYFLKTIHN